jgi:hypothetical protein
MTQMILKDIGESLRRELITLLDGCFADRNLQRHVAAWNL